MILGFILFACIKANLKNFLQEAHLSLAQDSKMQGRILELTKAHERLLGELENSEHRKVQKIKEKLENDENDENKEKILKLLKASIYVTFILTMEEERTIRYAKMKPLSGKFFVELIIDSAVWLMRKEEKIKTDYLVSFAIFENAHTISHIFSVKKQEEDQQNLFGTFVYSVALSGAAVCSLVKADLLKKNGENLMDDVSDVFPTTDSLNFYFLGL